VNDARHVDPQRVRAANAALNHEEAAARKVALSSRPRMLFLELTRACNLTCPMCRPVLLTGRKLAMADELLDRVAEELFPYVEVVDLRGFGESTLDNRLLPLVEQLTAENVSTKILTNLSIRTEAYWRDVGNQPLRVGVSLEAASPDAYERSRRGAKHDRFLRNLIALRRAQIGRSGTDDIYFNVVVTDEYLEELVPLVELAASHQIPMIMLNPIGRDDPDQPVDAPGVRAESIDRLREQLERACVRSLELGVELRLGANLATGCTDLGGYDQCLHPWSYVFVQHDGGVGFCDHLIANEASIFGNLYERRFMDIWNGDEYQRLRRDHARHDFDDLTRSGIECAWCYKNRYTDHEDMIEPGLPRMSITSSELIRSLLPPGSVPEHHVLATTQPVAFLDRRPGPLHATHGR
jgi:MoaA/NifB/PqqE/SkfB family radical SAM enzyme